jgi:hypothetical protein
MQLRFQPATTPGDGEPVASWQQLGLRWLRPSAHNADPGLTPAADPAPTAPTSAPAPMPAPEPASAARAPAPHAVQAADARVDVRVCVDGSGKLAQPPAVVRSSGDGQFDAAALRIAQSASGSYWKATSPDPATPSGCVPLMLSIEQK